MLAPVNYSNLNAKAMFPHNILVRTLRTYSTESNHEEVDIVGILHLIKTVLQNIENQKDQLNKDQFYDIVSNEQKEYIKTIVTALKK